MKSPCSLHFLVDSMDELRYMAQTSLPGFGEEGQLKLLNAHVVIVGMGGLGCPASQYLAAAGVGRLTLVDHDVVGVSNLHRQLLFDIRDVGQHKVAAAARELECRYPDVRVRSVAERISESTVRTLISDADVVLDATDDIEATLLLNDVCCETHTPLVYGSIYRGSAQLAVFTADDGDFRAAFPVGSSRGSVACSLDGVLGPVTGIVGCYMALETIKLLAGIGKPRTGVLSAFDLLGNNQFDLALPKTHHVVEKQHGVESKQLRTEWEVDHVTPREALQLLDDGEAVLVDVRQVKEQPRSLWENTLLMGSVNDSNGDLLDKIVVFGCAQGIRSATACNDYSKRYPEGRCASLIGGIPALNAEIKARGCSHED